MTLADARAEPPPLGPNERSARLAFHLGLAAILLPLLSLPILWAVAGLVNWRREPGERRFWGWMVLGLAALDTLASTCIALVALGVLPPPRVAEEGADPPRLGVALDPASDAGARVAQVLSDSPAARAGLRPDDRIVAIDGEEVRDVDDLHEALAAQAPGVERSLRVARAGEELELSAVPVGAEQLATVERGLFEPIEAPPAAAVPSGDGLLALLPGAAVFLALWARARRAAPAAVPLLLWTAAFLVSGMLASAAVLHAAVALAGGWTSGAFLLALAAGTGAPLVLGWIARRRLERAGVLPRSVLPRLGLLAGAYGLGLLYLIAFLPRVGALAAGVAGMLEASGAPLPMTDPLELLQGMGLGAPGTLLFVLVAAVLAPLSEELVFRGVLLPWLARGLRPAAAVAGSALLFGLAHPHYGAFVVVPVAYGLVLGWARLRTGGVLACVLLHATINAVASARLVWPLLSG